MTEQTSLTEYGNLVGSIYQGVLEEKPWQTFMDLLRQHFNSKYTTFILKPPTEGEDGLFIWSNDIDMASALRYHKHYYSLDPFANIPNKQVTTIDEIVTDKQRKNLDYFTQFLDQRDVVHILGVNIDTAWGTNCRLRLCRGAADENFNDADKLFLSSLVEHIERATQIHLSLHKIKSQRNLYANAISQLSVGTIILDESGSILHTNQAAQTIIDENDSLTVLNKQLTLSPESLNARLHSFISQAVLSKKRGTRDVVGAIQINCPSSNKNLDLIVRSIPPQEGKEGEKKPSVAIFVSDPSHITVTPTDIIRTLFGLTKAESELAILLADGLTIDQAAKKQSITNHTARSHLRSIYTKTGLSRQTMLVRLILKSIASLGTPTIAENSKNGIRTVSKQSAD